MMTLHFLNVYYKGYCENINSNGIRIPNLVRCSWKQETNFISIYILSSYQVSFRLGVASNRYEIDAIAISLPWCWRHKTNSICGQCDVRMQAYVPPEHTLQHDLEMHVYIHQSILPSGKLCPRCVPSTLTASPLDRHLTFSQTTFSDVRYMHLRCYVSQRLGHAKALSRHRMKGKHLYVYMYDI